VLFGRDAERTAIGALLDAARDSRGGALFLRGEPGIGKTALLEDTRDRAADMHVLSTRGVESESELPFAAVHQLLRPVLSHLETLPGPQSTALRSALGLQEGPGDERFLIFAGCLSLLSDVAERRPVLCLVDDAHCLDAGSADALAFVARRLDAEGIAMVFAARAGEGHRFEAADLPSLALDGLDVDAAGKLLTRAAGSVPPSVRAHLIQQARGNALALVELPSALTDAQLAGEEPLPETLHVSDQLERSFLDRVRRLPGDTLRLLLVAAADDTEDVALVMRAAELMGEDRHALAPAEQAGLISVHGNRLEFRHPLVRSAVYWAATSSERRDAHRVLAQALEHDESRADGRAWHLAASAFGPDEAIVQALEQAAERAAERGGQMAAAKALARAAELSADSQARGRRLALAARAARIAGADDYAVALANQADSLVDDPMLRAEIACAIGAADVRRGRPSDSFPRLIEAAGGVAPLDLRRTVDVLIWANAAALETGNIAAVTQVSKAAGKVVRRGGDDELMHVVRALAAFARALEGKMTGDDELEEAFVWASSNDDPELVYVVGVALALSGDDQHFEPLNDRAVSLARTCANLGILAQALTIRAVRRAMQHRFDAAVLGAEESLQFARELGSTNFAAISLSILAYIAAVRGEDEQARRYAGEAFEIATAHGLAPRAAFAHYALAMLDLGRGRWDASLEHLQGVVNPRGAGHPLLAKWALPDVVEAAVRAGRIDEAHAALSVFEEWTTHEGPAWARARLASCRALIATGDEATASFEEALQVDLDERPFDYARMRLFYGEHLRRERRRADSRVQLRAALEGFERLQAEPWAERARIELRASGETARKRDPSTIDQLTPQELQIARLVAEGLSNKEVAAQLFLSPRTIDYHLRHVFAKLGITSRTQLARLPLGDQDEASVTVQAGVPA
jgi:DNA-binding CsgD family transcriptional regulator